jgi:AcrR family transcriptional regulator
MYTVSAPKEATMRTTPAGERLLDAASELFYTRGLHAVGVDLIAETAGTTKKTLYDRFGSKDELIAMYLRRRFERWQDHVTRWLAGTTGDRVLAVFDALEDWFGDHGCAFINAHAEIGRSDHPAIAVILAEKQWMRDLYERLATEAGAPGTGPALHLLHEGAMVARTVGGQQDAIATARETARRLLNTAG